MAEEFSEIENFIDDLEISLILHERRGAKSEPLSAVASRLGITMAEDGDIHSS